MKTDPMTLKGFNQGDSNLSKVTTWLTDKRQLKHL